MARNVKLTAHEGVAVLDGPDREDTGRQRTVIGTTGETPITVVDPNNYLDIYSLRLTNTSATAAVVDLRDMAGGGIVDTFAIAPGVSGGFHGDAAAAQKQQFKNNSWTVQCRAAVASMEVSCFWVKRTG